MDETKINPAASSHIPGFLPGPDGSDPLLTVVLIGLVALLLGLGALYFALHALPEKIAHRANHMQMQVIGILALLALFTHNNIFWVAAILLAAIRVPDFLTPLQSIAESLRGMRNAEKSEEN